MATTTTICRFLVVGVLVFPVSLCAAKSKSSYKNVPQTVYDQKQHGDYNVQLHLKDFQIIALLGGDALGDYDYNYDYADFTVKPSTHKPPTEPTSSPQPPSSSSQPTILIQSTTLPPHTISSTTQQQSLNDSTPTKQKSTLTQEQKPSTPVNVTQQVVEATEGPNAQQDKLEKTNSPGKIKVQIIETPVGIVPGELHQHADGAAAHGEILHLRRCAQGFSRDKKGRCRRVRKPGHQLPYGFSRIANNLASRLRHASSEESLESSESSEEEI